MSWDSNAPPDLVAFRTQLALCAAWITEVNNAGQEQSHIHYPKANPRGTGDVTPDPLPISVVSLKSSFRPYAAGAGALRTGMIEWTLFVSATGNGGTARSVGEIESLASTLVQQLCAQKPSDGAGAGQLLIRPDIDIDEATEPSEDSYGVDTAATPNAYRAITIRMPIGLG